MAQEVRLRHGDLLPAWAGPPCAVLVRQPAVATRHAGQGLELHAQLGGGPEWLQGMTAPEHQPGAGRATAQPDVQPSVSTHLPWEGKDAGVLCTLATGGGGRGGDGREGRAGGTFG